MLTLWANLLRNITTTMIYYLIWSANLCLIVLERSVTNENRVQQSRKCPETNERGWNESVLIPTGTLWQGPQTGVLLMFVECTCGAVTICTSRVQPYFNVFGIAELTCKTIMEQEPCLAASPKVCEQKAVSIRNPVWLRKKKTQNALCRGHQKGTLIQRLKYERWKTSSNRC